MNVMPPFIAPNLAMRIADAKDAIKRGDHELLATKGTDLLPWAGHPEVDCVLGTLLKLLMRCGSPKTVQQIEREAFTLERLSHGWNPHNASVAYIIWKYRQAFPPEHDPDIGQLQHLALTVQALWPHLDEATKVTHGLYVKLATVHGTLCHLQSLQRLAEELLLGGLEDERQQSGLLRIVKQLHHLRAVPEIESVLEQLIARPKYNNLPVEIVLIALAALRALAQRLSDHLRLGSLIARFVDWLEHNGHPPYDKRLVTALINCADFDRLHELLPYMAANLEDVSVRSTLLSVLDQLLHYEVLGEAGSYIKQLHRQDPSDPMAVLLFGKFLAQQGVPHAEIAPLFAEVRPDGPQYDKAILWIASLHYKLGEYDQVIHWLDAHPLLEPEKASSLLNRVHAAKDRPPLPYTVDTTDGERINIQSLGPLGPLLEPLVQAMNGDLSYKGQPLLAHLSTHLRGVINAVANAIEQASDYSPFDCLKAARELNRAATFHLRDMVIQHRASPIVLGPQYGVLDIERVKEIFKALHRAAVMLSQYGIEAALREAPLADVRHLCQLAEIHIGSALALGETQISERLIQALRTRRVSPTFVQRLLERCALNQGDLCAAAQIVAGQSRMPGEILSLVPFEMWVQVEAQGSESLVNQKPCKGAFEYLDSQGTLCQAQHEVPASQVHLVNIPGLRVRDIELLIGPKGSIPKPHPWHFRDADGYGYPRASSIRLNHGQGGCRLRFADEKLHIREPVVALANMDGPYWRNYYHWMLLVLTRVSLLLDRGIFEHRRLLVPMELTGWMETSLELIGLPEDRMLRYTAQHEVLADDAMVVGPVEFAAIPLVKSLQRRLWSAADVDPEGGASGRAVWLSRRQQPRRYLANTESIEALARQHGVNVVAPESLSLIDQIRLCAHAPAIAGPDGACLTNLIFARPGTRVLGLAPESNNYPTFIDLCAVADLPQRWILGRTDPRKSWWGGYHQPFEVDMSLLEQMLLWLITS